MARNNNRRTEAYRDLRTLMEERRTLQAQYDSTWAEVRRGYNRQYEIDSLSNQIGSNTHQINQVIGRLASRGGTYSDKLMALSYLKSEIERKETILRSWEKKVSDYRSGRRGLIDSTGRPTDDRNALIYISKLETQIAQMRHWESTVRSMD